MGIPGFLGWLRRRHPKLVRKHRPPSSNHENALYVDMNALIHPACRDTKSDKERFHNVEKSLRHVVQAVQPSDLLFVSVDGVAPRAKMQHQRHRRFLKDYEQKDLTESERPWNSNLITPGTPFMRDLNLYLQYLFQTWRPCAHVIFSDSTVPGEGEHKILKFMRLNRGRYWRQTIFSPDADLLLLGMALDQRRVTVMRADHKHQKKYWSVFLDSLRGCLTRAFCENSNQVVADLIFLSFMGGNDFLPAVADTNIGKGELELWLDLYQKHQIAGYPPLTTADHDVNWPSLKVFLSNAKRSHYFHKDDESPFAGREKKGHRAALDLFEAWSWTMGYYYRNTPPCWDSFYPQHHAPTLQQMLDAPFPRDARDTPLYHRHQPGRPVSPFEQLVTVLPISSWPACLPSSFATQLSPNHPLRQSHPAEFEVKPRKDRPEWDVHVYLPPVRKKEVSNYVRHCLTSQNCALNALTDEPLVWKWNPKRKFTGGGEAWGENSKKQKSVRIRK